MKRRTKTKFTQIHVSIPVRLLEDLDETLGFKQSRSRLISILIDNHLNDGYISVESMSFRQLVAALIAREECDKTLELLLLQILSK